MKNQALKHSSLLLQGTLALLLSLGCLLSLASGSIAFAEPTTVTIDPEHKEKPARKEDKPAFHRKLWTGKFDVAGDHSAAAARQLEGGLNFACRDQFGGRPAIGNVPAKPANVAALQECEAREAAAQGYGKTAAGIAKQQRVMSVISKTSDVAALASVGGVIYAEMGVKKNGQDETYDSAAKIQRMAGTASYVTGATDMSLGAWAYVAQKRKLEEMQKNLNGNGAQTNNAALNSNLANAVEATKKAAMSHLMWGAGKVAAGYGMMKLAERTEKQAERMRSIQEIQDLQALLAARNAAGQPVLNAAQLAPPGSGTVPYYQNNQPAFVFPTTGGSGLAPNPGGVSYAIPNGGASVALGNLRNPASSGYQAKITGAPGGSGGAGAGDTGGASVPPPGEEDAQKAKAASEAMGNNFVTSLTGGPRSFSGSPSEPAKDEMPNLAAMLNPGGDAATAATGLSPSQIFNDALEGTEGTEQGSMSGVNGKSETSLFQITREKITKMFQVGNVGIPKDVEVRN